MFKVIFENWQGWFEDGDSWEDCDIRAEFDNLHEAMEYAKYLNDWEVEDEWEENFLVADENHNRICED